MSDRRRTARAPDHRGLRIVVASGKGGTGKTTVATSLAAVLADEGHPVGYVDCDAEEPNGHLFLKPVIHQQTEVVTRIPEIDAERCTGCGDCATACRAGALLVLAGDVVVVPNLCNGCGGCVIACPEQAIGEIERPAGTVRTGAAGREPTRRLAFVHGETRVGTTATPEVIRAAIAAAPAESTLVLDAPPGTTCPAVTAMRTADVALLVAEPTPFGHNDLQLTVEVVRQLGLPFGVVINRSGVGDHEVAAYCAAGGIPVLLEIQSDRRIAEAYSRGDLIVDACPQLRPAMIRLAAEVRALAARSPGQAGTSARWPSDPWPAGEPTPPPSTSPGAGEPGGLRELVVVSGKGGTGKTSITASLLALARRPAAADCDADAANLHLVLDPRPRGRWPFSGGSAAVVEQPTCTGCGICADACRFDAIAPATDGIGYQVDPLACEGCGVCVDVCPVRAVELVPMLEGEWSVCDTERGPLTRARLAPGRKNSGKLVSLVRDESRAVAGLDDRDLLVADGAPGIGCAVIASITGANAVLIVTEPTLSGLHDLQRVADLARQLGVRAGVCINKADLNPQLAVRAETEAAALGLPVLGRVRYDDAVTLAQLMHTSVVDLGHTPAACDIRQLWQRVTQFIEAGTTHTPLGRP